MGFDEGDRYSEVNKAAKVAEKAGLKAGDVIVKADGKSITTRDELNEIKNSHQIGDTITLTVNRNGSDKDITVTLEETP